MQERTSTTERYTRGAAAALVAVATLLLAANVGPARAASADDHRTGVVCHPGSVCPQAADRTTVRPGGHAAPPGTYTAPRHR